MTIADRVIAELKRRGPSTATELAKATGISNDMVRYNLWLLRKAGQVVAAKTPGSRAFIFSYVEASVAVVVTPPPYAEGYRWGTGRLFSNGGGYSIRRSAMPVPNYFKKRSQHEASAVHSQTVA